MTRFTPETLWERLPAVYRLRDAEQGGQLRALIEVLGEQARLVEEDIAGLYENWFIETCDEWVVPYIGDLLGVRSLHAIAPGTEFTARPRVANTLAFRRRKGTATMLEQLARDATGWPARAVEFFEILATTQHTNHVRPHNRTTELRDAGLELLDTAFDTVPHTADVRRIAAGRGRHNIPNVGLFLWRLQSYFIERAEARAVTDPPDGRFRVHPFGLDVPLFNRPRTEMEITHLAEEHNVPGRLRRRPLYDELEAARAAYRAGRAADLLYTGPQPVIEVFLEGAAEPLRPEQILVCDLSDWDQPGWAPPDDAVLTDPDGDSFRTRVAVDPVLGRVATLDGVPVPGRLDTSHAHGFPGDLGGGPYNRRASLDSVLDRPVTWRATVGGAGADFTTLTDALTSTTPGSPGWNDQPAGSVGVIAIIDNGSYAESLTGTARLRVPDGSLLVLVAAGTGPPGPGAPPTTGAALAPDGRRAHLIGDIAVDGTAPATSTTPGTLVLDGLWIEGRLRVLDGHVGRVRIAHTTLGLHRPDDPVGITVDAGNPELIVELDHALCGPIRAPAGIREVRVADSVIQAPPANGGRDLALAGAGEPGPAAVIERSTLLGGVRVRELRLGSESLFTEPVVADRLQTGCVRFSYVPAGSRTPRRHRCQPTLALRQRAEALGLDPADLPAGERERIVRRVRPTFTATRYGDPAYAQLAMTSAVELRTGAEDGSEMGAWNTLRQPQRVANLETSLGTYLRFGLEAGLIFVT